MNVMPTPKTPNNWRAPLEMAVVVSTVAVALALTLSWFVGVNDSWIVVGTIVAASVIGWRQPEARLRPATHRVTTVQARRRQSA